MSLSLSNMLERVKRNVPTTVMDTELQDALLERMNFLVSADVFPFQEVYLEETLTAGDWRFATPDNFGTIKDLVIFHAGYERQLEKMDAVIFDKNFPMPSNSNPQTPDYYCIKVAEGEIWLNCPIDIGYKVRIYFYKIPDDATDTTISHLTELAKLTLIKWASADGFRMMGEHDRADKWEEEGNKFFVAMKRRYQLALEEKARFISPKEMHKLSL